MMKLVSGKLYLGSSGGALSPVPNPMPRTMNPIEGTRTHILLSPFSPADNEPTALFDSRGSICGAHAALHMLLRAWSVRQRHGAFAEEQEVDIITADSSW